MRLLCDPDRTARDASRVPAPGEFGLILFFALIGVALAISGVLGFLFFWAMAQVHLRDRREQQGADTRGLGFASPHALVWLLSGRYRGMGDAKLDGLALPAQFSLWCVIVGLLMAALLVAWAGFA